MIYYDGFAGICGFHLGIAQAHPDWKCSGACEIDKHCQKLIGEKFPEVNVDADIREIDKFPKGTQLVSAGTPCQDFSIAGNRAGLAGARSGLLNEFLRVAGNSKTPMLLLENVDGIFSSKGGWDFARVLLELERLGYAVQWATLNTIEVLPQNRSRAFIVATLGTKRPPQVFPIGQDGADADDEEAASGLRQTAYALKARDYASWDGNFVEIPAFAPTLTGGAHSGGLHSDMLAIPVLTPDRAEKRQNGRRFKNQGEASFTLTSQDRHGVMLGRCIRRLTPLECERLQGFPDNWTAGMSDSQRYKALGNAVSVPVVKAIAERLA